MSAALGATLQVLAFLVVVLAATGVIVHLRRTNRRLRQSDERFQQIARTIQDVFWLVDLRDGHVIYVSPAYERVWGRSAEELYGDPRSWISAIHPDDRAAAAAAFDRIAETGLFDEEYRVVLPDGTVRWIRDQGYAVRDETGRFARIAGLAADITEGKVAREQARESDERYRAIVESANEGIWSVDANGATTFANAAMGRLLGVAPDEMIGRSAADFIAPEPDGGAPRDLARPRMGIRERQDLVLRRRDGARIVARVTINPLADPRGEYVGMLALVTDVTAEREAEAQWRRLDDQLRQSQRMESLGALAGGVAHDFNNLLVGILGNAGLAKLEVARDAAVWDLLDEIERAGMRAAQLTQQLLQYAGRGTLDPTRVDLTRLVRDTDQLLRISVASRAALEFALEDAPLDVEGDASQLRQLLVNLVTNASEALGDDGGSVRVRTGWADLDAATLADLAVPGHCRPGRHVFVEVADSGCGMDEATRARIFEPFFTTKFLGRGLGLAAVAGIAGAHGGAIGVRTEPGGGTVARVYFPSAAPSGAEVSGTVPIDGVTPRRSGWNVLIVDDDPAVRRVAAAALSSEGYRVEQADCAPAALARLEDPQGGVDLVLLDLTMPDMDGAEVLATLARRGAAVPVIVMSGFQADVLPERTGYAHLRGFVAKPFRVAELREAVRRGIAAEAP